MKSILTSLTMVSALLGLMSLGISAVTWAHGPGHSHGSGGPQHGKHPATVEDEGSETPIKMTMKELHRMGGMPPGWKFSIPGGDPDAGREVFIEMKCYTCHRITGEKFPEVSREEIRPGPDLTGMGVHHPREYFAEAVLNPNAVIIVDEPGYTGRDGLSIMPDYTDTLTVRQWINLVTYLKSLRGPMKHRGMGHGHKH
ncbi:MAG: c-type cytochrome [Candidatus Methylomirabilales bacterium]